MMPAISVASASAVERSARFACMGGWLTLRVVADHGAEAAADRDLRLVAARIAAWAARITRFDPSSELSHLNRHSDDAATPVGASLGELLRRAQQLSDLTDGLVDVSLLDARIAAERGGRAGSARANWHIEPAGRGYRVVRRGPTAFDLDGVGKGWIADRALALLARYPAAMVDADGDIALRPGHQRDWGIAIADPRRTGDLAVLAAPDGAPASFGVATSGTTVHRWELETGWAHHLIDPRTGSPAETDVVQATVVAEDALVAESLAKAAVIAGSDDGLGLLDRAGAEAAFLLLVNGELIAPAGAEEWLT